MWYVKVTASETFQRTLVILVSESYLDDHIFTSSTEHVSSGTNEEHVRENCLTVVARYGVDITVSRKSLSSSCGYDRKMYRENGANIAKGESGVGM